MSFNWPFSFGWQPGRSGGVLPEPTPGGVTNTVLPTINGVPRDGTFITVSMGVWTGTVTSFDAAIVTVEATPETLWSDTGVDNGALVDIAGDLEGETLRLVVTAQPSGVVAQSATFGPLAADNGNVFVGAWVWTFSGALPPPSPYPWTAVMVDGATNRLEAAERSLQDTEYGPDGSQYYWFGSLTSVTLFNTTSHNDMRLQRRMASNVGAGQADFRVLGLEPDTDYLVFVNMVSASTASFAANARAFGIPTATGTTISTGPTTVAMDEVLDLAGNLRSVADWSAASEMGGTPVTVRTGAVSGSLPIGIFIARSLAAGSATPNFTSVIIFKKAPA